MSASGRRKPTHTPVETPPERLHQPADAKEKSHDHRIDHCAPDLLELAVDYVEQHVSAWPTPASMGLPEPLALHMPPPIGDLRAPPQGWLTDLLQGRNSPKFRLLRRLNLAIHKLTGTLAMRALDHPSLVNVRQLDLGENNKLSLAFFNMLRQTRRLPALEALVLRHLTPKLASALCGDHNLRKLRFVTLAHPDRNEEPRQVEDTYDELFKADWWSQVQGLCGGVAPSRGAIWSNLSAWSALANNLHRLHRLQHLMIGDAHRLDVLIDAGVLHRIKHLSIYYCGDAAALQAIDALANHDHTVEHLDIARAVFSTRSVLPAAMAAPRQTAYATAIAARNNLGAVQTITWCPRLVDLELRKKLSAWAERRDINLLTAPW